MNAAPLPGSAQNIVFGPRRKRAFAGLAATLCEALAVQYRELPKHPFATRTSLEHVGIVREDQACVAQHHFWERGARPRARFVARQGNTK